MVMDLVVCPESDETYDEMRAWLQMYQQPQSKLLEYWQRTAKRRLNVIHGPELPDFSSVLVQWPRYKDKDGHILVSALTVTHSSHSE